MSTVISRVTFSPDSGGTQNPKTANEAGKKDGLDHRSVRERGQVNVWGPTNYDTRQNEVGKVVERPPPDVQLEVEFHVFSFLVIGGYSIAFEVQKVPFLKKCRHQA